MKAIRRILFAVKDPAPGDNAGIDKAIDIAKRLGASLELFHAISAPVFLDLQPLTGTSMAEVKREALQQRLRRLEHTATRAECARRRRHLQGAVGLSTARSDRAACQSQRRGSHHRGMPRGSRLKPWLMHLTDWELLRTSPVPVLLFKNTRSYMRPAILAAVDPSHRHAKPAQLDAEIVTMGKWLRKSLAVHCMPCMPTTRRFSDSRWATVFDADTLAATYEQQKRKDSADFKAFAEKAGISRARRHEVHGDPVYRDSAKSRGRCVRSSW